MPKLQVYKLQVAKLKVASLEEELQRGKRWMEKLHYARRKGRPANSEAARGSRAIFLKRDCGLMNDGRRSVVGAGGYCCCCCCCWLVQKKEEATTRFEIGRAETQTRRVDASEICIAHRTRARSRFSLLDTRETERGKARPSGVATRTVSDTDTDTDTDRGLRAK